MIEKAGAKVPDATWTTEDFKKLAQDVSGDGVFGFATYMGAASVNDLTLLYAEGATVLSPDNATYALNGEAGVKGLQVMVDLFKAGAMPPDSATVKELADVEQGFIDGRFAIMPNGSGSIANLKSKNVAFTVIAAADRWRREAGDGRRHGDVRGAQEGGRCPDGRRPCPRAVPHQCRGGGRRDRLVPGARDAQVDQGLRHDTRDGGVRGDAAECRVHATDPEVGPGGRRGPRRSIQLALSGQKPARQALDDAGAKIHPAADAMRQFGTSAVTG